ncbi:MAG TPA: hypothetical protein VK956_18645, partial [Verrucomicrobium sp.]|nr:hypothetical protein [Verrucomicrobium sp.]
MARTLEGATVYYENFQGGTFGASGIWNGIRAGSATIGAPNNASIFALAEGSSGSGPGTGNYLFVQHTANTSTTENYLLYDQGITAFNPGDHESLYVTWAKNWNNPAYYRLAVKVDDGVNPAKWYATTTSPHGTNGATLATATDLLTASWYELTATAGPSGDISPITTSTLTYDQLFGAGAQITGIGYYVNAMPGTTALTTMRLDNLTVSSGLEWNGGSGTWDAATTAWHTGTSTPLIAWENQQTA